MFCVNCGEDNPDKSKFCFNCGAALAAEPAKPVRPPQPAQPAPVQQQPYPAGYVVRPAKDRSTALILEILPGLFGLLGFGWIYAGNAGAGIAWLVGMLIWTGIAALIAVFSVGLSLLCTLPISIAMIVISAMTLNSYTKQHTELFGP
jgi:TM2 domain-containing membrane protein YozV